MDKNYKIARRLWLTLRDNRFVLLMAVWLGISAATASAQVALYSFTEATTTYSPITGGTVFGTTSTDDQVFVDPAAPTGGTTLTGVGIPIGFNFVFNGETFDRVAINANGWISLGQSALTPSVRLVQTSAPLSSTTSITPASLRNRIAGFTRDLVSQANGAIRVATTGTAPNQVFVVQWENYKRYTSTAGNYLDTINFQIRLYESGNVEVVFGPTGWGIGPATTATCGLGGTAATDYNSRTSTTSWTGTSASTANTNTLPSSDVIFPPAGLVYRFTPPPPMTYSAAQILGIANRGIGRGTETNAMAVLNVQTTGAPNPISVTDIQVNTGSTPLSNISNLKVFYTGGSTTFSTATQFGSTVASPAMFNTVAGTQVLTNGNNYFWVTYDVSATATIGDSLRAIIPSVNAGGSARVVADSAAALPRGVAAPLSGVVSVGTGQTYTSLNSLFTAINTAGLSGNITVNITSDITEPAAAVLNQWNELTGSGFTMSIQPTGGIRTISGAVSGSGVLVFNMSDRVTIDGRIGGSGRNLRIDNTSAGTTQVGILLIGAAGNGCENVVLRNLVVKGSLNNTGLGTVAGIQAQGPGHTNLLITENHIIQNNLGINVFSSATPKNNVGVRITNNIIGSDNPAEYVTSRGIFLNGQEAEVSGNKMYNFISSNSGAWPRGIELGDSTVNTNVFNNTIDNLEHTGTGFKAGQGIYLSTATAIANSNVRVYNNAISRLKGHGSGTATNNSWGIVVNLGKGYKIWNNSVSISDNRTSTSSTDLHGGILINSSASTNLDIRNNNISVRALPGNTAGRIYGIRSSAAAAAFDTLSNNNYNVDSTAQGSLGFIVANINGLAQWQLVTGKETGSKTENPNFWAADMLVPNSVALDNSGMPIAGLTTDITGAARSATTPDIGAYEFSPVNSDIAAIAIIGPDNIGCFTNNESAKVVVRNTGLQALNFATNNLTVTIRMSGVAADTASVVLNSGTLNAGDTLHVTVNAGFNMASAYGVFNFSGELTLTGDGISLNNTFPGYSVTTVAPMAAPFGESFEGGTSTAALANWSFTGSWFIASNSHGNPGNGLYFNIYDAVGSTNPNFSLPSVGPVPATANFSFSYRLMNWSSYPADSFLIGGADSLVFEVSTDCGLTFTRLYRVDSMNHTPSRQWSNISVPMAAYAGQNVLIRFRGHWGSGDYFVDLDNIVISEPLRPFALLGPASNTTINTGGFASSSISAGWNAAQTGPVVYRWQLDTISGDFSNPYLNLLSNNSGADTSITLTLGEINDFLDARGIAVGGTLASKWRVTASYGAQVGISTNTNNLTLIRGAITPNCPITMTPSNIVNDTICGAGPASVSAQGVGPLQVVWYDGTAIGGSGSTYDFASVAANTSINVGLASSSVDTVYALGPIAPSAGADPAGNFTNGMYITVLAPIRIDSITFRSTGARQGRIQVWNANPTNDPTARILQSQPWTVPGAGITRVPVEVYLTPGSYYINNTFGAGTGILFRSTSGATFPYVLPGKMSIDSSWLAAGQNLARIYYFFDMRVVDACYGPTAPATVTVTPAPVAALPYTANLEGSIPCNFINSGAWQAGTAAALSGTGFTIPAPASGTGIAAAKTAGRLVSPSFDFSAVTSVSNLDLSLNAFYNGNAGSKAYIEVSVDSGVSFIRVDSVAAGAAWQTKTVSLVAYAGLPSVHFAFNHAISGGAGSGFAIDNIALNTSCGASQVVVNLRTDIYGSEITWTLRDSITNDLIASGGPYPDVSPYNATAATHIDTFCVPSNTTLQFRISDSYGDGLWDGTNAGTYEVSLICPAGLVSLFAGADSLPYGNTANPPQYDSAFVRTTCFIPDTLSAFNLLTPANSSTVTLAGAPTQTVDFTWQASTRSVGTEPVTYTWTLETATGNPVAITSRSGLTSPNVSLTYLTLADTLAARGLLVGGTFNGRWKVVANSGTMSKDAVAKFNISITRGVITSVDENELGRAMNLYPNPTSKVATLAYNFSSHVDLKVVVVNAVGQEVLTLNENGASRGELSLDVANLQEGLYFVRITDGMQTAVKRLMIQR